MSATNRRGLPRFSFSSPTSLLARFLGPVLGLMLIIGLLLPAGPAHGQSIPLPVHVEHDGIVVRAEAGLEALAADIAAQAPAQLARIREDLAELPAPPVVEIRLVKRGQDMPLAGPPRRGAPEWASGVAYPDLGLVVVATRREAQPIDVPRVVEHELAHLAMGAALHGRAPRWLDEGFAFVQAAELSIPRTYTLTGMAWTGDVIPLSVLDAQFRGSQAAVDRAYAQSYDFVTFLARRGRYPDRHDDGNRWPFRQFLAEIAAGRSPAQAAWAAYGAGLPELFEEWRVDLRDRYLMIPSSLFALGLWVLAAVLLVIGYARRRRLNRITLERWEREEAGFARGDPGQGMGGADNLSADGDTHGPAGWPPTTPPTIH